MVCFGHAETEIPCERASNALWKVFARHEKNFTYDVVGANSHIFVVWLDDFLDRPEDFQWIWKLTICFRRFSSIMNYLIVLVLLIKISYTASKLTRWFWNSPKSFHKCFQINWNYFKLFPECLEAFWIVWKVSKLSGNFHVCLGIYRIVWIFLALPENLRAIRIVFRQTENIFDSLEDFQTSNFQDCLKTV